MLIATNAAQEMKDTQSRSPAKDPFMFTLIHTYGRMDLTVGGNQSTLGKPTQACGEHVNSSHFLL